MAPVRGVRLDAAALGPGIGGVVMVHVGEQEAGSGFVDDDPHIGIGADGPEVRVAGGIDPVKAKAGCGGIELQIEGGSLRGTLRLAIKLGERGGEGFCDPEISQTPVFL